MVAGHSEPSVGDGIPEFRWPDSLARMVSSGFSDGASLTSCWVFPPSMTRDALPSPAQGKNRSICSLYLDNFQSSWIPGTNLLWKKARETSTLAVEASIRQPCSKIAKIPVH